MYSKGGGSQDRGNYARIECFPQKMMWCHLVKTKTLPHQYHSNKKRQSQQSWPYNALH